jgi:hypothetical protein
MDLWLVMGFVLDFFLSAKSVTIVAGVFVLQAMPFDAHLS